MTFEYVMLAGVNDADEHARQLANLLNRHDLSGKVNLIPHNQAEPLPYRPSATERVEIFREILESKGVHGFSCAGRAGATFWRPAVNWPRKSRRWEWPYREKPYQGIILCGAGQMPFRGPVRRRGTSRQSF